MTPARAASFLLRRYRVPNHQSEGEMRVAPAFGRLLERVFRPFEPAPAAVAPLRPNLYRETLNAMVADGRRRDELTADRSLRP